MELLEVLARAQQEGLELPRMVEELQRGKRRTYHFYTDCPQRHWIRRPWLHRYRPVDVELTRTFRDGKLCWCVSRAELQWGNRKALAPLEAVLNLEEQTKKVEAGTCDPGRDVVRYDEDVRRLEALMGALRADPPKNTSYETLGAYVLQAAARAQAGAEATLTSPAHRTGVVETVSRGLERRGLLQETDGRALVVIAQWRPSASANLLDAVVRSHRTLSLPDGRVVLEVPRRVGEWTTYAALMRGTRAQWAEKETGDTPETIETALGLHEPGSEGVLAELSAALEAARKV